MKITFLLVFLLPCNMLDNTAADIASAFFVQEAIRGSLETSVNLYYTKLCDIPEYCVLHSYHSDNVRYRTFKVIWNKRIICQHNKNTWPCSPNLAIWAHKSTAFSIHVKSDALTECQFQVSFRCVSCQCRLLTWSEERKHSSGSVLTENITIVNKACIYNLVLK